MVRLHQTEAAKTTESFGTPVKGTEASREAEVLRAGMHTRAAKIVQALVDYRSKTGRTSHQMLSLWRDLSRGQKYDIERALKRDVGEPSSGPELWRLICSELASAMASEVAPDKRAAGGDYQENCVHDLTRRSKTCRKCGWSP